MPLLSPVLQELRNPPGVARVEFADGTTLDLP